MAQATLNATLLDGGGQVCDMRFQYGKTLALGTFTPWVSGFTTGQNHSQLILGLAGPMIYYFRAEARNVAGTSIGATLSFITTSSSADLMAVMTLAATQITEHAAVPNGLVVEDGDMPGAVRFEYGASQLYGMVTPWQSGFASGDLFSAAISGLAEGQAYHFRAQFASGGVIVNGADAVFSTLSPIGSLVLVDADLLLSLKEA